MTIKRFLLALRSHTKVLALATVLGAMLMLSGAIAREHLPLVIFIGWLLGAVRLYQRRNEERQNESPDA